MPPLSHLTSYTLTKCNLYLANSLPAAICEPSLYRLLTFHVPNKMSPFLCLVRDATTWNTPPPKIRVGEYITSGLFCLQEKHLAYEHIWTCFLYGEELLAKPQAVWLNTVGCYKLLIQYIRRYPPYRRQLLQPQPEDEPCLIDKDPQTRV